MTKSKCITYALLFVLSFIGSLSLFSDNALAVSDYDNIYNTTDELILQSSGDNVHYPITLEDVGAILAGEPPAPFYGGNYSNTSTTWCPTLGVPCGRSLTALNDVLSLDEDNDSMSVSQAWVYGDAPGGYPVIVVCVAKNAQMVLNWDSGNNNVRVTGQDWCIYLDSNSAFGRINVRTYGGSNQSIGNLQIISTASSVFERLNLFCQNCDPNYPPDYEGLPVVDQLQPPEPPEQLYPDYSWQLQKDENGNGILNVKYLANLPHFLTGTSHLVVEKMTTDWDALDENLGSLPATPGGWADWNFNIGDEAGYYMFRIDHNQQLDSPPWPSDHNYAIGQVYYQFFWDGHTSLAGSTVGCDGTICNQFTDADDYMQRYLHSLQVNSHGLTAIVTAPLAFIAGLPAAGSSCSPIVLPAPYIGNINLPCMKSYYEQHFGVPLAIYQAAVTAMFVYFVALGIFARIKDITNPKDDSIEAVKL